MLKIRNFTQIHKCWARLAGTLLGNNHSELNVYGLHGFPKIDSSFTQYHNNMLYCNEYSYDGSVFKIFRVDLKTLKVETFNIDVSSYIKINGIAVPGIDSESISGQVYQINGVLRLACNYDKSRFIVYNVPLDCPEKTTKSIIRKKNWYKKIRQNIKKYFNVDINVTLPL
jgi:hypothetical protein